MIIRFIIFGGTNAYTPKTKLYCLELSGAFLFVASNISNNSPPL
jgi:hypothetical protein